MKFFSLIYQGKVHTATAKKVIPRAQFSTLVDANEILEKAREDADEHRRNTEEECVALKEEAKKEGHQEGLALFNEHLLFFQQELKKLRHDVHRQILPLALKAAKKIVAKELEIHPETIVDIVLQALTPVLQNKRIAIFVNKEDKEALEAGKGRIKKILEHIDSFTIQERSDVSPGGCVIETETGIINAGIENQWRALESAFEKYGRQRDVP